MERVQIQFLICRKSGCSLAPLASFLPMFCISGMLGQHWHHIGLMLGHFMCILGSVLVFVMDLGVSVSLNFRPCKALGCVANVFDATGIFPHLPGEGC